MVLGNIRLFVDEELCSMLRGLPRGASLSSCLSKWLTESLNYIPVCNRLGLSNPFPFDLNI